MNLPLCFYNYFVQCAILEINNDSIQCDILKSLFLQVFSLEINNDVIHCDNLTNIFSASICLNINGCVTFMWIEEGLYTTSLRVSEANEVPIGSRVCVASSTFKQLYIYTPFKNDRKKLKYIFTTSSFKTSYIWSCSDIR